MYEPLITIKEDINLKNFIESFFIDTKKDEGRIRATSVKIDNSVKLKSKNANEFFNSQLAQNIMIVLRQIQKK